MINILIRAHDRPKYLENCVRSIEKQTYKDWNIIISVDNKHIEKYVKKLGYEYIRTDKVKYRFKKKETKVYWNLYFNTLQDMVKKGYVVYMDEDMEFFEETSLQKIIDNSHKDELLIFKYRVLPHGSRHERPTFKNFYKRPQRGTISTGCFSHHTDYKARWPAQRAGDYFAVSNLYGQLKTTWLNEVIINGQKGSVNET